MNQHSPGLYENWSAWLFPVAPCGEEDQPILPSPSRNTHKLNRSEGFGTILIWIRWPNSNIDAEKYRQSTKISPTFLLRTNSERGATFPPAPEWKFKTSKAFSMCSSRGLPLASRRS